MPITLTLISSTCCRKGLGVAQGRRNARALVTTRLCNGRLPFSGAIALCTERIRLDPQYAENYIDRGIYYCRMATWTKKSQI